MTWSSESLPSDWQHVALAEVSSVCRRGRAPAYEGGETVVINQKCVRRETEVDLGFTKRTNEQTKPLPDWAVLRDGDILVNSTGSGTLGRVAWLRQVPHRMTADTHVAIVRPRQELIRPAYLGWYLHSLQPLFEEMATGSTNQKELRPADLQAVRVPLPSLDEQDRIVLELEKHLTTVEFGMRGLAAARRGRTLYRRAVLQAALGQSVAFPKANGDAHGSALPALPAGWEWSTVAEEGHAQLGRMLNKERSSGPHMRPYLRVANVLDDRLDLSDVKQMDFPPDEYERYQLQPGDILLNEGQSPELLGRPAMYRGELPGVCFQKTLLRFQAGGRVNPEFALLVFLHYLYAGRFRRESRITTGIGHLTGVRFAAMEFPVAPLDEQLQIVARVRRQLAAADELDVTLEAGEADGRTLRASLLRDAFCGQLVRGAARQAPAGSETPSRNTDRAVLIRE